MSATSSIEQRDGGYWVGGTRVSLDSLVYGFREGQSAESLAQSFPGLTLEGSVRRAIAYSLAHQEHVENALQQHEQEVLTLQKALRQRGPMFSQNLAEARRQREAPSACVSGFKRTRI